MERTVELEMDKWRELDGFEDSRDEKNGENGKGDG